MSRIGRPLVMPVEDRKKEIFAAAEKLFGQRSYEKVTMSDIASEAGMSKKTLYVHFADKEALLTSLVASSYVWSDDVGGPETNDAVKALQIRLKLIADHVLSERHIKLCRLAIGESVGIAGLTDTFYQMGINASRQSLVDAVEHTEPSRRVLKLASPVLADMLFGVTIGRVLIDALLKGQSPDLHAVYRSIEQVVAALFTDDEAKPRGRD